MVAPRNLGQQVALQMGWTGEGQGQGGHINWVNSLNDQQRQQYNQMTGGNPTAATVNNMPALTEPLHQYEMQGLKNLGEGMDTSQLSAILQDLRGRMDLVDRGVREVTPDEIAQRQNPYAQAMKDKLSTTAEKIRAQILANQGNRGGRSFGDTSMGVRESELDKSLLEGYGTIDYNTWNDTLAQLNAERNRYLTGADTATRTGAVTADVANTLSSSEINNAKRQVEAGKYIRDYNQGVNDIMTQDILAGQEDESARLKTVLDLLSAYGSNTSAGQTGGMASPASQFGGALAAAMAAINKAGVFS